LCQWTLGYQYKTQFGKQVFQEKSEPNFWYVNSSDGVPIESSEVIKIYNKQMSNPGKWRTFDDFCNCAFGYWKISIDKDADENNWKKSTCTCPIYLKQYICKHIIAICIALKKVGNQLPPAAKSQPVGTTRGPGRPRLAVRALLEQPQFVSLIDNNDLSDLDDDDDEVEVEHAPLLNIDRPIANTSRSQSTNNTFQSNLLINHPYETNDYFESFEPAAYRYDKDQANLQDQHFYNDRDSNYDSTSSNFFTNTQSSSSTNFSSTINSVDSNNFNKNQNNLNSSEIPYYTNLTSSTTTSIAQTLSSITSTNFIEANNFNNSAITFPLSHVVQQDDEEEEVEEMDETPIQVQPSTSTAVLVKKRGRPADSPETKLRKATAKALTKKPVAKKVKK
jgi:hypothetical protein